MLMKQPRHRAGLGSKGRHNDGFGIGDSDGDKDRDEVQRQRDEMTMEVRRGIVVFG